MGHDEWRNAVRPCPSRAPAPKRFHERRVRRPPRRDGRDGVGELDDARSARWEEVVEKAACTALAFAAVILRVESPEGLRGRIASVNFVFIGASNELGAFESGVAASIFGVVPSIVGGGLLTLAVVAGVALALPQMRQLDLQHRMADGPGAGGARPTAGVSRLDGLPEAAATEIERLAT